MRRLVLVLAVVGGAAVASAEPLATLHAHNGALPPPHRRDLSVEIDAGGAVRLRVCRGYGNDDALCRDFAGQADPAAVAGILAAAGRAGLPGRPIAEDTAPPVGGGAMSGSVAVGGTRVRLPAFPAFPDLARNADVLAAILAAVPPAVMAAARAAQAD
jgi:hypothetical protein